ncbi:toll/interleukin-1 receptor domain-containing protein [Saccharothrix xinjiangensis]|uniref:TIR domain-containing protein n=1 Tax=Saccharothrix xinjiangensis TaxID=204798 RepID=A0ABV9XX98_9PSEU
MRAGTAYRHLTLFVPLSDLRGGRPVFRIRLRSGERWVGRMKMKRNIAFWSYARADDQAEQGRITMLARDIAEQYTMLTGEPVRLFVDQDDLMWGADWHSTINATLSRTAFFVPVVTPRFLQRPQCRRELNFFARRADQLGVRSLIMPIRYTALPEPGYSIPDPLAALIGTFNSVGWEEHRLEGRESPSYRRAVSDLASRMVGIGAELERNPPAGSTPAPPPRVREQLDVLVGRAVELGGSALEISLALVELQRARAAGGAAEVRRLASDLDHAVRLFAAKVYEVVDLLYDIDPAALARLDPAAEPDLVAAVRTAERAFGDAGKAAERLAGELLGLAGSGWGTSAVERGLRIALGVFAEGTGITTRWVALLDSRSRGGRA